jgi:hypothetical protein
MHMYPLRLLSLHNTHPTTVFVWHEGLRPRIPDLIPCIVVRLEIPQQILESRIHEAREGLR